MSTIRTALNAAATRLADARIDTARLDARVLLAQSLGVEPSTIVTGEPLLTPEAIQKFEQLITRRLAREPVAYLTGEKEFWSLSFAIGPGALIPRPDSETLIEQILAHFPDHSAPLRIVDLGTGSGCLLLTALTLYPYARGLGVEASPQALLWAQRNADRLGLADRCSWYPGPWSADIGSGFDLVISNPPYISRDALAQLEPELAWEPVDALDGGPDGLEAYRSLAGLMPSILAPGGYIFLEIGANQGQSVPSLLEGAGLFVRHVAQDLAGHARCVVASSTAKKTLERSV